LFAVDVLEAFDSLAVGSIATYRVGEIGFGARYVGKVVDADFRREVEQLGGFGLVGDGLGARLVKRYELVETSGLSIGPTQKKEGLIVAWLAL